jgi:hypothetical protein
MAKLSFKKQDINNLIKLIKEQDQTNLQDDTLVVSPEEIYKILPAIDYNLKALSRIKKYKDKKIIIDGDFSIDGKPVKSLGPIVKILGSLDISKTDIASIEGVTVTGRVSDWYSERARIRERKRIAGLRAEAQSRREDDDWNIEKGDSEGLAAQAIFKYLQGDDEYVQTEEDVENLRGLKERLGNLYYDQEQGNDSDELQDQIDEIEADIEEIEEKIDVYELIPSNYGFYGNFYRFEIFSGDLSGREYVAGLDRDAEDAALEYAKQYIDDVGVEGGFSRGFYEEYLDIDGIVDYFRDFYENDIRDNPEIYFDESDYELTEEQEKRKEQLEEYIEEMEDLKSDLEDQMDELEHNSDEYNEIEEQLQEVISNIDKAQDELDSIEPDNEPTEEMIEGKVKDYLSDVRYDPVYKLTEFGMSVIEWVDKDDLAQGLVDSDGYGIMNSYDGNYSSVYVNDEEYIVMRLN